MTFWLGVLIGVVIGACAGMLALALCASGARADGHG
jgi:hypothetical protein